MLMFSWRVIWIDVVCLYFYQARSFVSFCLFLLAGVGDCIFQGWFSQGGLKSYAA